MKSLHRLLVLCLFTIALTPLSFSKEAFPDYKHQDVVTGLTQPWALAFLPDGGILITEREGYLRIFDGKDLSAPLSGLPEDVYFAGQGGLLDVVLHPDFISNHYVYMSYASGTKAANGLKVVRGVLRDGALSDVTDIVQVSPSKDTPVHYGGRMVFLADGTLLVTTGDGFDYREDAQRLDNQMGKILRVKDDGDIPLNNPHNKPGFSENARRVYTFGHRNPQGLVFDVMRNLVFAHEHGPAGGDEINVIHGGSNYGWPVVTNGQDYSGASITPFRDYPGMTLPMVDWTPSIAPSGMATYQGFMFKALRGDLLVSTLKSREVRWVELEGSQAVKQHSLFKEFNSRIRDVKVHPDGSIYLLTDGADARIIRIYR